MAVVHECVEWHLDIFIEREAKWLEHNCVRDSISVGFVVASSTAEIYHIAIRDSNEYIKQRAK